MRNHVRHSRSERSLRAFEEGHEREPVLAAAAGLDDGDDGFEEDAGHYAARRAAAEENTEDETDDTDETDETVRLLCPDCGRPIAVLLDAVNLPQHAVCATPWNPFGLTVCAGSGRPVADARPQDAPSPVEEFGFRAPATLPASLDWRTQPFSHVGGPSSRPLPAPHHQLAA